jgi:hypothetical protein
MRSALALLCFAVIASAAFAEDPDRNFNGVTASFALLNPSLRARDALKVRLSLLNESDHAVTFRYSEWFFDHIEIFTARGEMVYYKLNSPTVEPIAADIPLKSGERFERIKTLQLSMMYDLAPGDYYLIFRYDLRELPSEIAKVYKRKLHSQDYVPWDDKKYPFHIRR